MCTICVYVLQEENPFRFMVSNNGAQNWFLFSVHKSENSVSGLKGISCGQFI